jgi:hypothetical protein
MTSHRIPAASTSLPFKLSAATLVLLTVALLAITQNAIAALAPALAVAVAWAAWRLPLGVVNGVALGLLLLADNVKENPGMGMYRSFLYAPGTLLYTAIPGIKLFGVEALLLALASLFTLRWLSAQRAYGEGEGRAARPFLLALWCAMGAIVFMELWGAVRGGDVRFSMLQFRPMLATSLMGLLFATSFKTRREALIVLGVLCGVAVIRNAVGIYYWSTILRLKFFGGDGGGDGTYVTTHSDSILSGVAMITALLALILKPSTKSVLLALVVVPVVGFGIHVNNRRLAIVSIALSFLVVYLIGDPRVRRLVHRVLAVLAPLLLVYVVAGWNAGGAWAKPVQTLKSVTQSSDDSAKTRDIENFNLVQTIKNHTLLGSGFGHEYDEQVVAYDISHVFEAYRYVPHNSLLGLFLAGGAIGFALFWSFTVVGVFLAVRASRRATNQLDRLACLVAVAAVVQYGVQAWGDMGLQSWMGALVVSSALGVAAQIATRTGAWVDQPPAKTA